MTLSPDDRYRRNLGALRVRQADVAGLVDAAVVPDGVARAVGRDGSPTLLVPNPEPPYPLSPTPVRHPQGAALQWFGGSSMPLVSAEEMFCNVRADGGSVTLPGILSGVEALVIAGRLARHAAVFVVEESPLNLKLAMHVHDYAELLGDGRLVFMLADDLGARLRTFFAEHAGYELPGNMFRVPQRTAGQIAELQRRIEQAGGEVVRVQTEIVAARLRGLSGRSFGLLSDAPRVAVLSVDARSAAMAAAGRVVRALPCLGWPYETCVPDRPDRRHVAARLAAIERSAAEWVLYVGGTPAAERALLPSELPVVGWYLPECAPPKPKPCSVPPGRFDLFLAGSQRRLNELLEAGFPRDQVERFEPAADVDPDDAESDSDPRASQPTIAANAAEADRVAVMMDLPDDRPEVGGITMPSHVALWRALQDRVLCEADRYDNENAESVLEQAERASGTTLTERGIRDTFAAMLRSRIGPATVARSLAQTLVKKGRRIGLWGVNWPAMGRGGGWPRSPDLGEDVRRGPIPVGAALRGVIHPGELVVLPWFSAAAVQTAVDALVSGAVVVIRGSEAAFAVEYPDLAAVACFIRFFRTGEELVELVNGVMADRDRFFGAPAFMPGFRNPGIYAGVRRDARRLVLAEHTVAARVERIAQLIRERQSRRAGSALRCAGRDGPADRNTRNTSEEWVHPK